MSSYEPPEEDQRESSHDPGVKEKEIVDSREFKEVLYEFDRTDYVLLGLVSSVGAGMLTTILVLVFVPDYVELAERIVEAFLDLFL